MKIHKKKECQSMFKEINRKRLAGAILAGVITITGSASAFAADLDSSRQPAAQSRPAKIDFEKMSSAIEAAMEKLVTAGTITQVQADAVLKVYTPGERKDVKQGERKSPLDELVTAGTITQDQSDAVSEAIKAGREAKKTTEGVLEELVTAGTITQAQSDAVAKIFTSGERKGMQQGERKNPLDELVTAGTITQAQSDAVSEAVKAGREAKKSTKDVLKELVAAGTITQAQSDTVAKIFTPGERKGTWQGERKSPLDELVTAGTITEAQADAINEAVKAAMETIREQ